MVLTLILIILKNVSGVIRYYKMYLYPFNAIYKMKAISFRRQNLWLPICYLDFSTMLTPVESISFILSFYLNHKYLTRPEKPCIFIIHRAILIFFALYIEHFLSAKFILRSNTHLFCKVIFSPDKFRLFFLWQIIE